MATVDSAVVNKGWEGTGDGDTLISLHVEAEMLSSEMGSTVMVARKRLRGAGKKRSRGLVVELQMWPDKASTSLPCSTKRQKQAGELSISEQLRDKQLHYFFLHCDQLPNRSLIREGGFTWTYELGHSRECVAEACLHCSG